jgi:hypothetical protein
METPGNPALPELSFVCAFAFDHLKRMGQVQPGVHLLNSPLFEAASAHPAPRLQKPFELSSETP